MTTLTGIRITAIEFRGDSLIAVLSDGRRWATPLEWYPQIHAATREQRERFLIYEGGQGVHWPALDEDLGLAGMLAMSPSVEYRRKTALIP
jgi:hypothetical protein